MLLKVLIRCVCIMVANHGLYLATLYLLALDSPQQDANVVTRLPLVQKLLEHLHAGANGLRRLPNARYLQLPKRVCARKYSATSFYKAKLYLLWDISYKNSERYELLTNNEGPPYGVMKSSQEPEYDQGSLMESKYRSHPK